MSRPRIQVLHDSVNVALQKSFQDSAAHEGLVSATKQAFASEDATRVEGLLEDLLAVLQRTTHSEVDKWASQRGLSEAWKTIDEHCLRTCALSLKDERNTAIIEPSLHLPVFSFEHVRCSCKNEQLANLRKELSSRSFEVEEIRSQVQDEVKRASLLSREVCVFGNITTRADVN